MFVVLFCFVLFFPIFFLFFFFFCKLGPISRGFSISKAADFILIHFILFYFFAIFMKWDPLLRICLTKMGSMSEDFWWKSNLFGRHIPACLNMWVPPPGIKVVKQIDFFKIPWKNTRKMYHKILNNRNRKEMSWERPFLCHLLLSWKLSCSKVFGILVLLYT